MWLVLIALAAVSGLFLAYQGLGFRAWVVAGALALAALWSALPGLGGLWAVAALLLTGSAVLLGYRPLRRAVVTRPLMPWFARQMPAIGDTERAALESGTVWWDGELFSGDPDWRKLIELSPPPLSEKEQAFLEGPVEELCRRLDNWSIVQQRDLPEDIWAFLKEHRFFGMIIPEEHGGLGFSAQAHSAAIIRIASRSITAAVTVMVPNSLGPAELLLHYGTEEQKRHLLPRLAAGEELPCFALTEPEAGSDAAASTSEGVVCYGEQDGQQVLGMRLNWRKRYITLGPHATLLGLAFKLRDPDRLLGGEEELGITCALIPANLPGIEIGDRHDPMGLPFSNGPNFGRDVFVPLERIIGGADRAGQGWKMLMESLAAGRAISLPSMSVGAAQVTARAVGAYATVREQFNLPIGRFEGVEEPLARIGGMTYLMNAACRVTTGAIDAGHRPAVISAIVKRYLTEMMRQVVNDGMDIFAGAGICRGPRNIMERAYQALPIGITVEGANILTRSMIIFGQGVIRSHPYVLEQLGAIQAGDVERFDRAFFGHLNHIGHNAARAFVLGLLGLLRPRWAGAPFRGELRRYAARCSRMSAAFALLADVALGLLGGDLKRKEKLSGRFADALSWLYLASSAIKHHADAGSPDADRPYLRWACEHALWEVQQALLGVLHNLPLRPAAAVLRPLLFPWGARYRPPSDALGAQVAAGLLERREPRERLTRGIFVPPADQLGVGRLEAALDTIVAARPAEAKLKTALREGKLEAASRDGLLEQAVNTGVIDRAEYERLAAAEAIRDEVIQVDAFPPEQFQDVRG